MRTLKALDCTGYDLRIWCYACARAEVVDSIIWMVFEERGWDMTIEPARQRFRCKTCRSKDHVLIVPTKRAKPSHKTTGTDLVVGWFHANRAASKAAKRKL